MEPTGAERGGLAGVSSSRPRPSPLFPGKVQQEHVLQYLLGQGQASSLWCFLFSLAPA